MKKSLSKEETGFDKKRVAASLDQFRRKAAARRKKSMKATKAQSEHGCDITPLIRNDVPFNDIRKDLHTNLIIQELSERGILVVLVDGKQRGITALKKMLKENEAERTVPIAEVKHFTPIGTDYLEYHPEDDENDGDD